MVLGATRGIERHRRAQASIPFRLCRACVGILSRARSSDNGGERSDVAAWAANRAAIVIYGIGLLPIVVLPVAYAITFDTQTLSESDIARVRELARPRGALKEAA